MTTMEEDAPINVILLVLNLMIAVIALVIMR